MKLLQRQLNDLFKLPAIRRPDHHRRARTEAKTIAAQLSIEIEPIPGGGFNVRPPKGWSADDPFEGDHYANDWTEVSERVKQYAQQTGQEGK